MFCPEENLERFLNWPSSLLRAFPPASEHVFQKLTTGEARNVPASIITRLVIGSIFP